ncbi:hypothetical protein MMC07_000387 [Pseudocyphellaria aurata]|nr:hypothetical protein [Pseudocyphellaria aurata]
MPSLPCAADATQPSATDETHMTAKDTKGATALVFAAAAGSPACMQLLLDPASRRKHTLDAMGSGDVPALTACYISQRCISDTHESCDVPHMLWALESLHAELLQPRSGLIYASVYHTANISSSTHNQRLVTADADALAAALGEACTANDQRKPRKAALTADRLRCVLQLVKLKCGMTQLPSARVESAAKSLLTSESARKVNCCRMKHCELACFAAYGIVAAIRVITQA